MTPQDLESLLRLVRRKTTEWLDTLGAYEDVQTILAWRPGPGRAHIAWQLMHIAATDDRHLNVRMRSGELVEPEYVRRFAFASVPDDDVPLLAEIRRYLETRREALLDHLRILSIADLDMKPSSEVPWTYREWFQTLAWHEGHHNGQAQLTVNLYRTVQDSSVTKIGH